MKPDLIKDKSFAFAVSIMKLGKNITENHREYVASKQLLKSGTSIGANVREAKNAESKPDFIHKMAIAQKECDETIFWLELLFEAEYITTEQFNSHKNEAEQLLKILRSIILTAKKNLSK